MKAENKRLTENALGTIKEIEGDLFVDVVDPVYSLSVLAMGQAEENKQLQAKIEAAEKKNLFNIREYHKLETKLEALKE